jgi:hypothetical protein
MRGGGLNGTAGASVLDAGDGAEVKAGCDDETGGGDGAVESGRIGGVIIVETGGGAGLGRGTVAGGGTTAGAGDGTTGFTKGAATTGRLAAGGGAAEGFSAGTVGATTRGGAGDAEASLRCVIAFKTSPGREMFDKSILVLISSSPRVARDAVFPAEEDPSAVERRYARTFSASCSSKELECVFFSVTPTSGSVSRMALLLTSSSRARSLMRTLLIRPFVAPCCG